MEDKLKETFGTEKGREERRKRRKGSRK